MNGSKVHVGAVLLAWLGIQIILFGLAYGWVAIYAYGINPGHDEAFYEAYALMSSPIIGILASFPACYAAAAWLRRRVGEPDVLASVLACGVLVIAIDVGSTLALAEASDLWLCILAIPLKIAGGWLAVRGVRGGEEAVAA
jgi:hypothetical protein